MTKYFCDACGKEVTFNHGQYFKYQCHIGNRNISSAYVDSEGNRVSGREDQKLLCNHCYNRVLSKAWQEYQEIIEEQKLIERTADMAMKSGGNNG